jgi:hypothetical protein
MTGREPKSDNDLFFVCSVIEHIGREMKHRRADVVRLLGEKDIARLIELADVLHCEPVENVAAGLIEKHGMVWGDFDNTVNCQYNVPTVFDIAKVYKRLIIDVVKNSGATPIDALIGVYTSWISDKISDYGCSMYYESPEYLYLSYLNGEPIKD